MAKHIPPNRNKWRVKVTKPIGRIKHIYWNQWYAISAIGIPTYDCGGWITREIPLLWTQFSLTFLQVWRCFKLWNDSLRVIALPIILLAAEIGNDLFISGLFNTKFFSSIYSQCSAHKICHYTCRSLPYWSFGEYCSCYDIGSDIMDKHPHCISHIFHC